jgi:hypothetical protein
MSRARNCGGYGGRVFGIADSFLLARGKVSTEPGQVQTKAREEYDRAMQALGRARRGGRAAIFMA